jgi:hypothetical protein
MSSDVQIAKAVECGTAVARDAIAGLAAETGTLLAQETRPLGTRHKLRERRVQHRGKKGNSNCRFCGAHAAAQQSGRGSTTGEGSGMLRRSSANWTADGCATAVAPVTYGHGLRFSDAVCDPTAEAVGQQKKKHVGRV